MHYGSLITAFRATNISYGNKKTYLMSRKWKEKILQQKIPQDKHNVPW